MHILAVLDNIVGSNQRLKNSGDILFYMVKVP
jgi:hypothetical protein